MKSISAQHVKIDRLSSYLRALGSNYGLFVANVGSYAIAVPVLLKWLGPERYGVWLIFLQLVYLVSFATMWVSLPILREAAACYVEADRQRTQRLFQTVSIYYAFLGTVTMVLMIFGSQFVPQLFKVAQEIRTEATVALLLLSAYIAGIMQLNLLVSLFNGFQQMPIANTLLATQTVLGTCLGVAAVAMGIGVTGLAIGQVLTIAIVCGIGGSLSYRTHRITWGLAHFNLPLLFNLLRSGTAYFGYCVSFLLLQSDILLVGVLLGPIPAAAYGIGYKLMDYTVQLTWKIPDSLLPMIAELDARESAENLRLVHRLSGKVAVAIAFLFATIFALYGHSALLLWVGAESTISQLVLVAFAMLIVLQVLIHSSLIISFGTNRTGSIARLALIEGAVKIVIAIVLLPSIGMIGMVLSTLIAQLCLTAWYVPFRACAITADTLSSYFSMVVPPALPAAVGSCFVGVTTLLLMQETWLRLLIGAPATVSVYVVIYLTQGVNIEERRWMIMGLHHVLQWWKFSIGLGKWTKTIP